MPTPADLGTDSESSATVELADSAIRLDRDPCGSEVFDLLHRRTQRRQRCARGLVDDAAGKYRSRSRDANSRLLLWRISSGAVALANQLRAELDRF